jgi:putative hemolysin
MTALLIIASIAATFVAAVVSGFETGVYSLSHMRLRHRLSIGDARARVLERLLARPQQLLTGILIAQNVAVYFATAVVTTLFQDWGLGAAEVWSTLILGVVFFIFVESTPKNVFRRAADILVYPMARPLDYLIKALGPVASGLGWLTNFITRLGAKRGEILDPFFTRERLEFYVREGLSEGILSKYQAALANNILRGEKVTVSRAMVGMEKVAAVEDTATMEEFSEISRAARFARYPVYSGAKDKVVGTLNIYDCHLAGRCTGAVEQYVRPAVFLAPDVKVTEAIMTLRDARTAMGIVADSGRAVGIVTLEDCLEEIVGEIYSS